MPLSQTVTGLRCHNTRNQPGTKAKFRPGRVVHGAVVGLILIVVVVAVLLLGLPALRLLGLALRQRRPVGVQLLPRRVLDDVGGELVPHVDHEGVAAGGAARLDGPLLLEDLEAGLGVLALLAQHKLLDEDVEHVLEEEGH